MPMPSARAWARLLTVAPRSDLAGVRLGDAVDDLHQRGFAGAILAQHGMDMSAPDGKRYGIIGYDRPVRLGAPIERQQYPVSSLIHAPPASAAVTSKH